jgi:hypothetical protein
MAFLVTDNATKVTLDANNSAGSSSLAASLNWSHKAGTSVEERLLNGWSHGTPSVPGRWPAHLAAALHRRRAGECQSRRAVTRGVWVTPRLSSMLVSFMHLHGIDKIA